MSNGSENTQTSESMAVMEPLPALHTPHKKRRTILVAGVVLATLDLCCLPITYFYALNFDTNLNLQDGILHVFDFPRYPAYKLQYSRSSPVSMGSSVSHIMASGHLSCSGRRQLRCGDLLGGRNGEWWVLIHSMRIAETNLNPARIPPSQCSDRHQSRRD